MTTNSNRTMINYQVLQNLVGSDKGNRTKFMEYAFGKTMKRSLSYFEKHDVTFSTAERIAEYLGVPLDTLRGKPSANNNVRGNYNNVGNIGVGAAAYDNQQLQMRIQQLEEIISSKDETIQALKIALDVKKQGVTQ